MEIKKEDYEDYLKEEYLSVHEAASLLEISEEELRALVAKHAVPTHNVAGVFTKLRRREVEELKNKWRIERELFPKPEPYFSHHNTVGKTTVLDRVRDFWYFNDFYIVCSITMFVLLYFIISSQ